MVKNKKNDPDTRSRLLAAACELFSERGYRETTIAQICKRAGANIAAINYHFGSKEALYAEAWRSAFQELHEAYPADGDVPPGAPPEERLRGRVLALMRRMSDAGPRGRSSRLLMRELATPTGVIDEVRREVIGPIREETLRIVRELLGPHAGEKQVEQCELSIINQCLALHFRKAHRMILGRDEALSREEVDELAEHIVRFSLAGIRATRQWVESSVAEREALR